MPTSYVKLETPNEYKVEFDDGSAVIVRMNPSFSWGGLYNVTACVWGASVVSCAFTPGKGFHSGSVWNDRISTALEAVVEQIHLDLKRAS